MRRFGTYIGTLAVCTAVLLLAGLAAADDGKENRVKWKRIVGILQPGAVVGQPSTGVTGVPGPWTVTHGRARVDLSDGHVHFVVDGLTLAASTPLIVIGTTGFVAEVRGTLVCNVRGPGASVLADTDAVPLSPQGDAEFNGQLNIPVPDACANEPEDIAFLIRVAAVLPDTPAMVAPMLLDRWIAHGAVRKP